MKKRETKLQVQSILATVVMGMNSGQHCCAGSGSGYDRTAGASA